MSSTLWNSSHFWGVSCLRLVYQREFSVSTAWLSSNQCVACQAMEKWKYMCKKKEFFVVQKLEPLDSICFTHLEVLPFVHQKVLDTCKILWQKLILWTSQSELYKTPRVTSICDNSKIRQYLYSFWVLVSEFRLVQVSLWFQGFISVLQRHFLFQSILFCIDQSDNTAQILPYRNVLM